METKYGVRIVVMDDNFSNSITSCDCGEYNQVKRAISIYKKVCDKPNMWIDTKKFKNFYVCVESFINVGEPDYEEWEYAELIKQKNFKL